MNDSIYMILQKKNYRDVKQISDSCYVFDRTPLRITNFRTGQEIHKKHLKHLVVPENKVFSETRTV